MRLLTLIKWILLGLLGGFALFNMLVIGVVLWAYLKPVAAWQFVQRHVLPSDLKINTQSLTFHAHKNTLFAWDFDFELLGLHVAKLRPRLDFPFERVVLRLSVEAFAPAFSVQLHDLTVSASEPLLYKPEPSEPTPKSFYQQLHSAFAYMSSARKIAHIETLHVNLAQIRLLDSEDRPLNLALEVSKQRIDFEQLDFQVRITQLSNQIAELVMKGQLDINRFRKNEPFMFAQINLNGPKFHLHAEPAFAYFENVARIHGPLTMQYQVAKRPLLFKAQMNLILSEHQLEWRMNSSLEGIPGPLVKIPKIQSLLQIAQEDGVEWSGQPSTFSLSAPLDLFFVDANMRGPLEKSCACRIPKVLMVKLEGSFWPKTWFEPSAERKPLVDAQLSVEGVHNKLFSADLAARLRIEQKGAHREEWTYQPELASDIELHSFQGLRRFADAKGIMIPAPLSALNGTVVVRAHGPVSLPAGVQMPQTFETPVVVSVDLESQRQRVLVLTTTQVSLDHDFKKMAVAVHARIDDLQLELPPLDPILGLPRMARDSRLQLYPPVAKPKSRGPKFRMVFSFDLETAKPGAIRLLSKLASPYLPLTVQIHQSSEVKRAQGSLTVEPFKISYLRRTVQVLGMRLDLNEDSTGAFPINGRLRIDQTDYKIFIGISGTTEAPNIDLSSEPYLGRNDIISVLLYDRTTDQLVSADAETSGSFQAAMADRAIGLFGLWALATTPIRSFSYNAVTKVYVATVQLADGLTAGIGTDWEHAAHLEVRKRISKRWVLTASWSPSDEQDQGLVGKVVLQWEIRF